jgi:eukaryotic-like serine/threonine-protein kinase
MTDGIDDSDPLALSGRLFDNRYAVAEKVGEGGMAIVYRARDTTTDEQVALKILLPALVQDVIAMKRLRREAELGARLAHKNLCHITRIGEVDGSVYVVMPFLQGESLAVRAWQSGQLPLDTAVDIVRDLSAGLHAAHELGIVHRDLKPENVMLVPNPDATERAVVLDFGLATETVDDPVRTKLTKLGMVVGTPEFMSPEQMAGRDLDRRSDVYSLAFMTSELLTGQAPFAGKTFRQMVTARMRGEVIPIRTQRPELDFPPAVERVLAKALSVSPDSRYSTAIEFGEAFSLAAGRGTGDRILG